MLKKIKLLKNKMLKLFSILFFTLFSSPIFAETVNSLGGVAGNIVGGFGQVAKLITGAAFVAGLGLALVAIFKFKAHRDNPAQIPVGTPIALLIIAAALIFTPSLFGVLGKTIFGNPSAGSATGMSAIAGAGGSKGGSPGSRFDGP